VNAKSTTDWTSFQGNGNQQISLVRYHRQRGEATSWPNEKHVFSDENLPKLCAKGAIQNFLNMLHFLPEDMKFFGE
jgi:hypothetical protein